MTRRFDLRSAAILPLLLAGAVLPVPSKGQTTGTTTTTETTAAPETPETVELEYGPEDQTMFDIAETFTRTTTVGEQDPIVDKRERTSTLNVACVTEGTDESFMNSLAVRSQTLKRDDRAIASPVNAAMMGLTLTYKLSKDGELTSITGYDGLPGKMREKFASGVAETLIRLLNLESLKVREEEAYEALYEELIGKSVTVGEASGSAHALPLPYGGSKTVYAVESSMRDTDEILTLTRKYNSDATTLAGEFDSIEVTTLETAATDGGVTDDLPDDHASASVTGEWTTVIDSDGLLIGSQTMTMTYTLSLTDPNGGEATSVEIVETTEFMATEIEETPMVAQAPQQ